MNILVQFEIRKGDVTHGMASFYVDSDYLTGPTIQDKMLQVEDEVQGYFERNYRMPLLNEESIIRALVKAQEIEDAKQSR